MKRKKQEELLELLLTLMGDVERIAEHSKTPKRVKAKLDKAMDRVFYPAESLIFAEFGRLAK
jgi:GTP cyclohydrolase I